MLEYYRSLAARAGYSAEHQVRGGDQVLGGVNDASDGAFYLIVTPEPERLRSRPDRQQRALSAGDDVRGARAPASLHRAAR